MNNKRLMIAAPKSGSGKTLITCALLGALKKEGLTLQSFKCGPDYIDPMFHRQVLGIPSENLDTWFLDDNSIRTLFCDLTKTKDIAVCEGVMGLYDGVGGIHEKGSSYDVARALGIPIVLVINARGAGRSIIPLIKGFLDADKERLIKGVILNRTGESFYKILKSEIENELKSGGRDFRVLGFFPDRSDLAFESRHLGLVMPEEEKDIRKKLGGAALQLKESVDMEALMDIAGSAGPVPAHGSETMGKSISTPAQVTLAVAMDEAFCFYYQANLRLFERFGAEIKYFSPIHDKEIPADACGILLGGGYPELHAEKLSSNTCMIDSIRTAIQSGMPSLAECGGYLYLHRELEDTEGRFWPMAGLIDEKAVYTGKSPRFGYIEISEKQSCFLPPGETIKGHEFHYWESRHNSDACMAKKPFSNRNWDCVIEGKERFWGFPHLYYPSNEKFTAHFIKEMIRYRER